MFRVGDGFTLFGVRYLVDAIIPHLNNPTYRIVDGRTKAIYFLKEATFLQLERDGYASRT